MVDHAKPILTDNYTDVLSQIRGRFEDQAKGFDPANTTATNISTGTIRWNSAEKKFQKWSGTAWGDLTDNYVLSGATFSTGTANGVAYLNGSKVLTTGSALTFDGTNLGVIGNSSATVQSSVRNDNTATNAGAKFATLYTSTEITSIGHYWDGSQFLSRFNSLSDLLFTRNNVEQMRLTSTGLGIGTSSPAYKLDVAGDVRSERWIGRINTSPPTADAFVYRPADNSLGFGTANTERMRLDASGNLGLGVVPSAWGSPFKSFDIASGGGIGGTTTSIRLFSNSYYNGSNYVYKNSAPAARYDVIDNNHIWFTAPSGTAGNTISFTQAMTLNANGNLLVGNTNGTSRITASGVIESTTGGFKFPDGTTQTTAATAPSTANVLAATAGASVGEVGTYAMLINQSTNVFGIGDTTSGTNLWFSNADGTMTGNSPTHGPFGQWRCMGRCNSNVAGNTAASRVTTWLRIS